MHVLAVGLEDGALQIIGLQMSDQVLVGNETLWRSSVFEAHSDAVRRLAWRTCDDQVGASAQLASCSDDQSIKIFDTRL